MRFNRGTIILLVISLVVIVGVFVLSSNQASAPDSPVATSTPAGNSGPLFPNIDQEKIVRFEVQDNASGDTIVMIKDADDLWSIDETVSPKELNPDQVLIVGSMGKLASITATDSFADSEVQDFNLVNYGLDAPTHTLTLTDEDGTVYTLHIGAKNPGETRYYARKEIVPGAEATAEPAGADSADYVYLVLPLDVNNLVKLITTPPYEPTPTPVATPFPTANPISEVDQTATAAFEQTATQQAAEATVEVTAEATTEATPEATAAP